MAGETEAVSGVQNLVYFLKLKGIEATEEDINSIFSESLSDGQEVLDNNALVQELSQNYSLDPDDEELMTLVGTISARDGVLDSVSYQDLNQVYTDTNAGNVMPECFKGKSADKIQKSEDGQYYVTIDKFDKNKDDNIDCISRLIYNIYGVSLYSDEGREIYQKLVEANPEVLLEDYNETVIHPNQEIVLVDLSETAAVPPEDTEGTGDDNQEYTQNVTLTDEQVQQYAQQLHDAANGLFVADITGINQMLDNSELSADDWANILNYYNSEYENSFVQDIDSILSGSDKTKIYDKMTKKMLESAQQGNPEAINLLCSEMYNATAGKLGTADEFVECLFSNASDEDLANIMDNYTAVTGSEIYKDIENDFSGETEQNYINRLQTAYQNAKGAEYNGWDDGDLSIQDNASNFVTGVTDKVKEQVSGVVSAVTEHPVITAGAAGLITGACIIGGPVVVAGVGLFGLGTAIYGGIKAIGETITGMNNYNNATTDAQAAEAMQDIGGSALEVGESAALAAMSAAQTVNAVNTARNAAGAATAAANSADDAARAAAQAGTNSADDAARAGAQAGANSADDAARAGAQAGTNSADDAARAGAQAGANSADDAGNAGAQAGANSADDAGNAGAHAGGSNSSESSQGATGSADNTTRNVDAQRGSGFTEWKQTKYAKQVEPLDDVLSELNDVAENVVDPAQIQALQEAIKNFMLNPTDRKVFRQLIRMVHPDVGSVEGLSAQQLEEIAKVINPIFDAVTKTAV